ncbi:MAG: pitrilysin family protein [Pseudomonadota bacterium]
MHMLRSIVAASTLLVAGPALAEIDIQNVTSPAGHKIWLVEEPSIPIVSIEIAFRGGHRTDPADKAGLTNFTFGMMNEGAGDLDAVAWSKRADDISARIGFDNRLDRVEVSARFLVETLEESTDFLAMTLSKPRFDAEPMERVRRQILSGIRQAETDPSEIASQTWWSRAFPDHPYGRDRSGTAESVSALTVADLQEAHGRLMTTANAYIAIVGAIDAAKAGEIIDRIFAELPKGEVFAPNTLAVAPPPGVFVVEQDVPQSVAILGHAGIERDDPDFIPAYVMNYILGGGGFSSRLTEEVREKRGLAYSVYAYLSVYEEAALYMAGVQTANERVAESIDVIKEEWARMAAEGLTQEDLDKAKTYLTGSFPLRFDSNSKIANYLLFVQLADLGIDYINTRNSLIEAVTLEQAKRAAARILDPDALSIVVVGKPVGL